jgi:glycosyltransferase involved in cell wall biosynthesis
VGIRVLVVAPFPPRPDAPDGGIKSVAYFVAELARRHDVGLVALRAEHEPPVPESLRSACEFVEEFERDGRGPSRGARFGSRTRLSVGAIRGDPIWVTMLASAACRRGVRKLVADWSPDIVQVEFHVMGQYALGLGDARPVVVLTEHEPGRYAGVPRVGEFGSSGVVRSLDRSAWTRYEQRLLATVDATVTFTDEDRATLHGLVADARIETIPLGVYVPPTALDPVGSDAKVLFVGSFAHPPNVDAAVRLLDRVMPLVNRMVPEATLEIVGGGPGGPQRENALMSGHVENIGAVLDKAAVVVAPVDTGGGMRVKVIEALAAGKAVVTSRRGARGLSVTAGRELVLAETDEEFAAAIVELLRHPERRAAVGAAARSWALANLSWERTVDAYTELYRELLDKGRPRQPVPAAGAR